ncbi:MAG: M16 family metallopeptidase [Alphaproteobacteria bacterium]
MAPRDSEWSGSAQLTRLENGLTVVTERMEAVETVSIGLWVGAGTRHETPEINGVAHLLEHMAFKGTETRTAKDIAESIEAVGGHLNAYTAREQTAYYAKVLKEDVGLALDIVGDIVLNAVFDETELAHERGVVLQEIGQAHDTPDDIIFDHFQETAFPAQALGRPVLGTAQIIEAMPRDALVGFMRRHYGADRMVLAAAGKVDHAAVVRQAERALSALPAQGAAPKLEAADYRGGAYREDRDLEQVHLMLGFPGVGYHDPDFHAASVLSTLFGGGMSSRLFQEIRERRGLVYSIYSYVSAYTDAGLFGIYAGTGEDEVAELVPAVCDEIVRLADTLEEVEVARARNQLRAATLMSLESSGSRCEQLGQQMLVYGRPLPVEERVARIEAIQAGDVARVARRIFGGKLTLSAIGPIGQLEPFDALAARISV